MTRVAVLFSSFLFLTQLIADNATHCLTQPEAGLDLPDMLYRSAVNVWST